MAVVRMDIDQADRTIGDFGTLFQEFADTLQPLGTSVDQLGQAWEGAAAQQFRAAWEAWLADMTSRVNALQLIQQGLMAERQQMLDADAAASFA